MLIVTYVVCTHYKIQYIIKFMIFSGSDKIKHRKKSKDSANDRVWSLTLCPNNDEDVSKRSSTPNYLQFGPNWVQIGHRSPEIEKLESFEEDGQEFNE